MISYDPNSQYLEATVKPIILHPEVQRLRAWILFLGSQAPELKDRCYDALNTTQNPPEKP